MPDIISAAWSGWLAALAVGAVIGSLPIGYVLWGLTGRHDLRRIPVYNVGLITLWRRGGAFFAVLTAFLDMGKAAAAVFLAGWLWGPAAAPPAAAGVLLGHLYPLPARWLAPGHLPRSRGGFAAFGSVLGLAWTGMLSWSVPAIGLAAWTAAVLVPQFILRRRRGYVVVGNVATAVSIAVAAHLLGHAPSVIVVLYFIAVLIVWRLKENLGRLADGHEPRFNESRPLPDQEDEVACAFMIHRMSGEDWWQTRRFSWMQWAVERGWLPESWLARAALRLRPMKLGELNGIETSDGRRVRVYLIGIPLAADQILTHERLAVRRAIAAARLAEELGARSFGLGAFWSIVGNKGAEVQEAVSIAVTNGGAYTAGTVKAGVEQALTLLSERVNTTDGPQTSAPLTAAVVGAGGVVGFGIARTVAARVDRLIMVGRNQERMERMVSRLGRRHPDTEMVTTTDMNALKEADIVFSATSQPEAVIYPQHLKPGVILFDLGRPADVDASVMDELPGALLLPGGVVRPPGDMESRIDLHFGDGQIPACLAETMILALTRRYEHRSLGDRTRSASIDFFIEEAERLGFVVTDAVSNAPSKAAG